MSVAEIALRTVACPRCHAIAGQSCAAAMRVSARAAGDVKAERELGEIDGKAPHLAHPERLDAAQALIRSAEAYGLVRRLTLPRPPPTRNTRRGA
jgi:hypothetical protein